MDKINFRILLLASVFTGFLGTLYKTTPQRVNVCINSSDLTRFVSRCIACDRSSYNTVMQGCLGQPFLPSNITFAQANCIIQACTQQQNTFALVRRGRRGASENELKEKIQVDFMDDEDESKKDMEIDLEDDEEESKKNVEIDSVDDENELKENIQVNLVDDEKIEDDQDYY